jgi:hypothetical protein
VRYWVAYLGLPWTRSTTHGFYALPVGPALLLATAALLVPRQVRPEPAANILDGSRRPTRLRRIAECFILLSLGISILAAVGRGGMSDPLPPMRYAVFMTPLHLGLLFLVLERWRVRGIIAVAVLVLFCAQQVLTGRAAISTISNLRMSIPSSTTR